VIFIHGYSLSLDSWERVLDLLPAGFRGYAYDLRGFGRSGGAAGYTLEDHVADLFRFMDALKIERAVLIGHSLGANIGQMALVAEPQRVKAFVMSNGPARNLPAPDPVAGMVAERIKAYGTIDQNRRVLQQRMGKYFDSRNVTDDEMRRFVEIGARSKTEALRQTLQGLYSHPIIPSEKFAAYRGPVLIVDAEMDSMTPLEGAKPLMQVLPQAEMATIASSGHSPMWEKPQAWSDAVYGFLLRLR
jgi:pimeloyl-ACP methyl ester carboxylesterase